jgi:DNA-binding CsgD family transcriptional regulator
MANSQTAPRTNPVPLERERELARIDELLAAAAGGVGQIEVIEAPSGMGKSTLLAQARAHALAAGMQVLQGAGSELEVDYPFGTVLTLFQDWLAHADTAAQDRLLRGRAALAAPLLRDSDEGLITAGDQFAIIHGLYWCTVNLSELGPTVLLVDDVHWADELSLRFLSYLANRLDDLPVVLLLAIRSGDPRTDIPLVAHLSAVEGDNLMRLAALTPPAVGELLRRNVSDLVDVDGFVDTCSAITGGNPFLVNELASAIRTEGRSWLAANLDRVETFAPLPVRRRVLLRLMRLGKDALALARACAVLGHGAPLGLASSLAGISTDAAACAVDRLVRADILEPGTQLAFTHPMTRSAVYEDLPPGERPLAHAAAAALLREAGERPQTVAHHLLLATPVPEPWALDALQRGAMAAARKGSPATAVRYLRHAISIGLPEQRRVSLLVDLGLLEAACGETQVAVARLEDAVGLIEEPTEQARCLYALGLTLYRNGRHSEAATAFERSALLAKPFDPELALAAEGAWTFTAYYLDAVLPRALTRLDTLSAQVRRHGAKTTAQRVVLAVAALHTSLANPPACHGGDMAAEALRDGALLREQTSESVAVNLAILALIYSDRIEEAASTVDDVISDARAHGNVLAVAEASLIRSFVSLARGDVTNAWIDAQAAVDGTQKGWYGLAPLALGTLAQCLIERGELYQAATVLAEAELTLTANQPQTQGLNSYIHMARGRIRLARSDARGALEDFLAAGRALSVFGTTNPSVLRWRSMAGVAAKAVGDLELATNLVGQELDLAYAFGLRREIGAALRAKAALVSGQARIDLLQESLAELELAGNALDLSETLCSLGGALRRAGHRVQSREPLSRALDLAHRNGALAVAKRAHDELLASGAKPRRQSVSGIDSLTPAERRIAGLAAQGLTNRAIAEALFLARSTVAWHLRRVFSKLEIDSRTDLGTLMTLDAAEPTVLGGRPARSPEAVRC